MVLWQAHTPATHVTKHDVQVLRPASLLRLALASSAFELSFRTDVE
jgi:hypothetical protein